MFNYSSENADFFGKKVESIKRGFYFRNWVQKAVNANQYSHENKLQNINMQQLPQLGADDSAIDEENLDVSINQQSFKNSRRVSQQQFNLNNDQFDLKGPTPGQSRPPELIGTFEQNQEQQQQILDQVQQNNNNNQQYEEYSQQNEYEIQEEEQNQKINTGPQYQPEKNEDVEKPMNLKFGDVIYLKYYVHSRQKGIMSGDGIASNKLELIPQDYKQIQKSPLGELIEVNNGFGNSAQLVFRKCLFKVVTHRKYNYATKLAEQKHIHTKDNEDHQKLLEDLQKKTLNEIEENDSIYERIKGINVIYGQEIQLQHIYSKCTLTLNPQVLAKANCCREMSLEEVDTEWSNFKIISINNAKKLGEPVLYSDYISLQSTKDHNQCLNVDEDGDTLTNGLEVNSFELPDPFKLCNYLDYEQYEEREGGQIKGVQLESGDIITLLNRDVGGNLGVKVTKTFEQHIQQRKIFFEFESRERFLMSQNYYNYETMIDDQKNSTIFYIDKKYEDEDELNINVLWEVQKADSFDSCLPEYHEQFKLKNVATGLFLMNDKGNLVLTREGHLDECLFSFQAKKSILQNSPFIKYNTRIKLVSYIDETVIMCLNENQLNTKKRIAIKNKHSKLKSVDDIHINEIETTEKENILKSQVSKCIFEMNSAVDKLSLIADQVASLIPYLMKFYMVLQDWGMVKLSSSTLQYSYKKAFTDQKQLFNSVLLLNQSLQNLKMFLTGQEESILNFRQSVLYRNGVLSILISILQLIHFHIYGNKTCADKKQQKMWSKIYQNGKYPGKSAQKIAYDKMNKVILDIYEIIVLIISGNSECSNYILQSDDTEDDLQQQNQDENQFSNSSFLEFFLDQYKYYKPQVQNLLREAVRYTGQSDEDEDNITKWTNKLESVTEDNVQEQTFIIELLSLTITDQFEHPIKGAQNLCRKKFFKSLKRNMPLLIEKTLISFTRKDDIPVIQFQYDQDKYEKPDQWKQKNRSLIQLYNSHKSAKKFLQFEDEKNAYKKVRSFQLAFINGYEEKELHQVRGEGIVKRYEDYVINCLQLYYYLAKDRNLKAAKQLQGVYIGLDSEFIVQVLRTLNKMHLRYYKSFLNLYQVLILDVEPFARISHYSNKCFIYDQIKDYEIISCSFRLFREITFSKQKRKEIVKDKKFIKFIDTYEQRKGNQQAKKITEYKELALVQMYAEFAYIQESDYKYSNKLMKKFTKKGVANTSQFKEDEYGNKKAKFPAKFDIKSLSKQAKDKNIDIDIRKATVIQLESFLAMLKIIKLRIDLGLNTLTENRNIYHSTANIFLGLIYSKFQREDDQFPADTQFGSFHKNWVFYFIQKACRILKGDDRYSLIQTKVFLVAVSIYNVLFKLKQHLQVISFIQSKIKIAQDITEDDEEIYQNKEDCKLIQSLMSIQIDDEDDTQLLRQNSMGQQKMKEQQEEIQIYSEEFKRWRQKFDLYWEDILYERPSQLDNVQNRLAHQNKLSQIALMYKALEVCEDKSNLKIAIQSHLIMQFNYLNIVQNVIKEVEIIEDEYELHLYKLVNGSENLNNENYEPKSAQDWQYMCDKAKKYIQKENDTYELAKINGENDDQNIQVQVKPGKIEIKRTQTQVLKTDQLLKQFNACQNSLKILIKFFEMSDYETQKEKPKRTIQQYVAQLQNIISCSGIYKSILGLLGLKVYNSSRFLEFYRLVVKFLYLFVKDNVKNRNSVIPHFADIANLAMIPCGNTAEQIAQCKLYKSQDIPSPLKIQNLCIELLKNVKEDPVQSAIYIKILFEKIRKYEPFDSPNQQRKKSGILDILEKLRSKLKFPNPDILKAYSMIQWMRILKSLTFKENNCNLKENQQKILNSILKTKQFVDIITPIRPEYVKVFVAKFDVVTKINDKRPDEIKLKELVLRENEYWKVKLHCVGLSLLTDSFKNYQQGIEEVQRFIMFESLKNILCNQFAPFIVKRAYIRALFEAYVNKVIDKDNEMMQSDTVASDDISGILSGEIIPQLDTKNIYKYLEGLVRVPKHDKEIAEIQWNIRKQIITEKIHYFEKNKEYSAMCHEDQQVLRDKDTFKDKHYVGIIKDPREFWKYIMTEGVMHFLTDTYDEKIKDIETENQNNNTLADEFSIIKTNMMKLRQLFDILERDFRVTKNNLHLDEYRDIMSKIEQIIPKRKIIKFGKNFRIGIDEHNKVNVETYDTVAEDMVGQGFQDEDDKNKQENIMKKYLRIFFMRNRIPEQSFRKMLEAEQKKGVKRISKGVYNVINKDKKYVDNTIITQFINDECHISQVHYKITNRQKRLEFTDFTKKNIDQVIEVIENFFKKAKGPKEIMDNDGQDQDLLFNQKIIIEPKYSIEMPLIVQYFSKLIIAQAKLDYHVLFKEHLEVKGIKEEKRREDLKNTITEAIEDNFNNQEFESPIHDATIIIDTNILKVLKYYMNDFHINDPTNTDIFQNFINVGAKIFKGQNIIYKIKLVKLFLQHVKLSQADLDNLQDDDNYDEKMKAIKKRDDFVKFQNLVVKSNLYQQALKLLSEKASFQTQFEALTLLNEMLFLGNEQAQKEIYNYLKKDFLLQHQFFTYLRSFFLRNKYEELKKIKQLYENNKKDQHFEKTEFEVISLLILEFLRLLCENVNSQFQNYLREQFDDPTKGANTNVILEISNFLTFFLEDTLLNMPKKQEIIFQCIQTLTDCVTGEIRNQKIVCLNKRLFNFLNEKIIMTKYNFEAATFIESLQPDQHDKEKELEMFNSAIYFILIILNANDDKQSVLNVLDQIDTFQLLVLMKQIFEQRIYPSENKNKLTRVILEINCNHQDDDDDKENGCNDRACKFGDITKEDTEIIQTGFNIFIFFSYMNDMFPDEPCLKNFRSLEDDKNDIEDVSDDDDDYIDSDLDEEERKKKEEEKQKKNKKCCGLCTRKKKEKQLKQEQKALQKSVANTLEEKKKQEERRRRKLLSGELYGINEDVLREMEEQKQFTIKKQSKRQHTGGLISKLAQEQIEQDQKQQKIQEQETKEQMEQKEKDKKLFKQLTRFTGNRQRKFFRFYKRYRGVTEILFAKTLANGEKDKRVQRVYFKKPFVSNYLTDFIKKDLIYESNRESDQERVEVLREKYKYYYEQMNWKQEISKYQPLPIFVNNWRLLKDLSFFMVLIVTITFLLTYDGIQQGDNKLKWVSTLNFVVSVIQLVISIIVVIFCAVERLPISIYQGTLNNSQKDVLAIKEQAGFDDKIAQKAVQSTQWFFKQFKPERVKKSFIRKAFLVLKDFNNIYNAIYCFLAVLAFYNPFIYAILLLDIVKQSDDLQNIIQSITQNFKNILKFAFLGLIIMTLYGIILYTQFSQPQAYNNVEEDSGEMSGNVGDCYPKHVTFCDDFILTISTCFNFGLTAGGGIADGLRVADFNNENDPDNTHYWQRYVFDLSWFILIQLLFIQIIFGIIVDTFSELRGKRQNLIEDIEEKCYICGLNKAFIDGNTEKGWHYHIYMEHNVYHMLFYMIYIMKKNKTDCDALEKLVKKQLENINTPIEFIPIKRATSINDGKLITE